MESLVDKIVIEFAKSAARGAIAGLMDRYSVDDLRWHISFGTNLVQEALRSPDPRDARDLQRLKRLARRYSHYRDLVKQRVSPDWLLGWLSRNYPAHALQLQMPRGRAWFQTNYDTLIDYFFE